MCSKYISRSYYFVRKLEIRVDMWTWLCESEILSCWKLRAAFWSVLYDPKWGYIIFPKRHFIELSFRRNAISPNYCSAEKKFAESHLTESSHGRIVELAKLYNAERNFSESVFSRTSFLRIVVQPNVVFPKLHLPERRFAEFAWSKTSFHRTLNRPPVYIFAQCIHGWRCA